MKWKHFAKRKKKERKKEGNLGKLTNKIKVFCKTKERKKERKKEI